MTGRTRWSADSAPRPVAPVVGQLVLPAPVVAADHADRWLTATIRLPALDADALDVAARLADALRAEGTGDTITAPPSVAELAEACHLPMPVVRRAAAVLVAAGLLLPGPAGLRLTIPGHPTGPTTTPEGPTPA